MTHAVIGASGVGRHHARIFSNLGIEVSAIVGTTPDTVAATAHTLEQLGLTKPQTFFCVNDMLRSVDLKSVSICSPTELHLAHIELLIKKDVAIFCEKPLFWDWTLDLTKANSTLNLIQNRIKNIFFMNNSSENYIRCLQLKCDINSFYFEFTTQGKHYGRDIAVDLMPHGLSMLYELKGMAKVSQYRILLLESDIYEARFSYGDCDVIFKFKQHAKNNSFSFKVNNLKFTRKQRIVNNVYEVSIIACDTNREFMLVDPFEVAMREFTDNVYGNKNDYSKNFEKSAFLQRTMLSMLLQ